MIDSTPRNILSAKIQIEGIRPILWHAFGPWAIPLEKQERTGVAGHDPEEWRKTVLHNKDGQLCILPTYVFGCIRESSRYTKKGRATIQGPMSATLQVTDDVILLDRFMPEEPIPIERTEPVYMDISSVRNPSTKGRNVRYRIAASAGWKTSFNILWDKTLVSRGEMESVIHDAGQLVGLGDGRSIGFGRFSVISFEVAD